MATRTGKILQRHIDEAMKKNRVPGCEGWTGSIEWSITASTIRHFGTLEVELANDGQGNLTGTMSGDNRFTTPPSQCTMTTRTPGKITATLAGEYLEALRSMSLTMTERDYQRGTYTISCAPGIHPFGDGPTGQPVLEQLLRNLTVAADGTVEAQREGPVFPAPAQATVRAKLKLKRTESGSDGAAP